MLSERVDSDFDYQIVATFILKNWRGLRLDARTKNKNKTCPTAPTITTTKSNNNKCTQEKNIYQIRVNTQKLDSKHRRTVVDADDAQPKASAPAQANGCGAKLTSLPTPALQNWSRSSAKCRSAVAFHCPAAQSPSPSSNRPAEICWVVSASLWSIWWGGSGKVCGRGPSHCCANCNKQEFKAEGNTHIHSRTHTHTNIHIQCAKLSAKPIENMKIATTATIQIIY